MAELLLIGEHEQVVRRYPLEKERISIGRAASQDVLLEDSGVSRRHAEIIRVGDDFYVVDCGSLNGLFVNGRRVVRHLLQDGDLLKIGPVVLRFSSGDGAGEAVAAGSPGGGLESGASPFESVVGECLRFLSTCFGGGGMAQSALEREFFEKKLERVYRQMTLLYRITQWLSMTHKVAPLVERVLEVLLGSLRAKRAFLLLFDEGSDTLYPFAAVGFVGDESASSERMDLVRGVSRYVFEHGEPMVYSPDPLSFRTRNSMFLCRSGEETSLVCVPLAPMEEGVSRGVLYLDSFGEKLQFHGEDVDFVRTVASQLALAFERERLFEELLAKEQMEREIRIAKEIQQRLVPDSLPAVRGLGIAARTVPARVVGGDFYDVVAREEGECHVVVADVSGKGIPAAIVASQVRSLVRVMLEQGRDTPYILSYLNDFLRRDYGGRMFVTLVIASFLAGRGRVRLVNAAHERPLFVAPGGGDPVVVEEGSLPCGLFGGTMYSAVEMDFPPGAALVVFTDGMVDLDTTRNRPGYARLLSMVSSIPPDESPGTTCNRVFEELLAECGGEPFDDMTLVVCRHMQE